MSRRREETILAVYIGGAVILAAACAENHPVWAVFFAVLAVFYGCVSRWME